MCEIHIRPQDSPGTRHEQRRTSYDLHICHHAASAWWETVSVWRHLSNQRGIRPGLCGADVSSLAELVNSADDALFQRILYNPNHVLHSLLADLNATGYYLRHRRHDSVLGLPTKTGILQINNFLIRHLYKEPSKGHALTTSLLTIISVV